MATRSHQWALGMVSPAFSPEDDRAIIRAAKAAEQSKDKFVETSRGKFKEGPPNQLLERILEEELIELTLITRAINSAFIRGFLDREDKDIAVKVHECRRVQILGSHIAYRLQSLEERAQFNSDLIGQSYENFVQGMGLSTITNQETSPQRPISEYTNVGEHYGMYISDPCPMNWQGSNPGHWYCPVTGQWQLSAYGRDRKIAHIIPNRLNNETVNWLLGFDAGQNSTSGLLNQLPMDAAIEEKFDRGQFTILPSEMEPGKPQNYKVFVVDRSIMDQVAWRKTVGLGTLGESYQDEEWLWRDIHGVNLVFLNHRRPGKRNIFYHALSAWIKAHERAWAGHDELAEQLFGGRIWAPHEFLLRGSAMERLAAYRAGCRLPDGVKPLLFRQSPHSTTELDPAFQKTMRMKLLLESSDNLLAEKYLEEYHDEMTCFAIPCPRV